MEFNEQENYFGDRRISVSDGEIVIFDSLAFKRYHGHVREYKDLSDKIKVVLYINGKIDSTGKIL